MLHETTAFTITIDDFLPTFVQFLIVSFTLKKTELTKLANIRAIVLGRVNCHTSVC